MIVRIRNGRVATPHGVIGDTDVTLDRGTIAALAPAGQRSADATIDLAGGWLLPGFVDTQVNGGGGVLFNDRIDVEGIAAIGAAHARFGTTAFLPTLISDTPARIAAALAAVDAAIARGVPGVVGVHIEGPFIAPNRRGIHEADRIRQLDPEMLALLAAPRRGRVMVTLAPETCDAADIRALAAAGVIVAAGHTDASYDRMMRAIAAGLSCVTHLFNAMSPLHHRDPGAVGAALDSDAYCGLIVDGVHVHPAAVRLAVRAKGVDRIMLVTDAMPSVGTDADAFVLQGKRIAVRDGVCRYADGTLAGAHLDMATCLRNAVAATGLAVADAARMASTTPARALRLSDTRGSIAVGQRADWVMLDAALHARGTWIGGVAQHPPSPAGSVD